MKNIKGTALGILMPDGRVINDNIIDTIRSEGIQQADVVSIPCRPILSEKELNRAEELAECTMKAPENVPVPRAMALASMIDRLSETVRMQQRIIDILRENSATTARPIVVTEVKQDHSPHGSYEKNVDFEKDSVCNSPIARKGAAIIMLGLLAFLWIFTLTHLHLSDEINGWPIALIVISAMGIIVFWDTFSSKNTAGARCDRDIKRRKGNM